MQNPRTRIRGSLPALLVVVIPLAWVLSCGTLAKADYSTTAHGNGTSGVKRLGVDCPLGTDCPPGDCTHCHDTFDPNICGINYKMLFFSPLDGSGGDEDFCMKCHTDSGSAQVGGMSGAPGDMAGIFADVFAATDYGHNVLGYSDVHRFSPNEEDRIYLSANKHVECNDCHNPHTAEAGLHNEYAANGGFHLAARTNEIDPADPGYPDAGPIKGAYGAPPTSWQSWSRWSMSWNSGGANWPATSSTATKEYEICFKCHSNYNTNFSSWGGADEAAWTNLALEFNPHKQSYHPVVQALPEIDPGYEWDPVWEEETDNEGSNQLPPAFSSVLIGDSGLATGGADFWVNDSTKSWTTNQWQNWGLRPGRLTGAGDYRYTYIGRITGNSATQLNVTWSHILGLGYDSNDTVYSVEYYAGFGTKSGTTVTDGASGKDFTLYLPSLKGYKVVIFDNMSGGNQNFAEGIITSNTATSFAVSSWTAWDNSPGVPSGGVPGNSTVNYYISAAGQTMMCSDCHSNDEISDAAAQGPHGSSVKWMLKGRNKAWPTLAASENGTGTGTLRKIGKRTSPPNNRSLYDGTDNGLFCLNCHSTASFSKNKWGVDDEGNVHIIHSWWAGPGCVECHIMVPHGGAMSRLMANTGTNMPARYAFDNNLANNPMTYFKKEFDASHTGRAGDPAAYIGDSGTGPNCSSDTVACHPNGWSGW